ncbi:uncharacterized protein FIESC28_08624 [Fusarium coffeatum]|uniref:Transcription factor domain-containing protein n=1 Tax=Fusarium coffeatum TaxID=231269 RepID=A0A366R841_9HYPO|nr:uncharacterized protein FIESC28_08624 [Fusarium coffeatum]RBR12500.1 hypothetical protein FIESC28_08624 [Fusarium coffeatum]
MIAPSTRETYYLPRYFDAFLHHNNFNPGSKVSVDVTTLMKDQGSDSFLRNAVLALGAMQAVKFGSSEGITPNKAYDSAVYYYLNSVTGLRQALSKFNHGDSALHSILWTTHLLGLFELMTDSTGQGWVQHLVGGTSKALVAAGPTVCLTGRGRRFFTEIRIFEVCRAIIFNEPTFLANSEWRFLTASIHPNEHGKDCGLNSLLDIITLCSTLRVRVRPILYFPDAQVDGHTQKDIDDAYGIALEGFRLRQALVDWEAAMTRPESSKAANHEPTDGAFFMLTKAFFAATSIYLSGVFDYEMPYWQDMGIIAPTLSEDEIQGHVGDILTHTREILFKASISPLLTLFPLRVAGARSWETWQQDSIMDSLSAIEKSFPVAASFRADLQGVWSRRELLA